MHPDTYHQQFALLVFAVKYRQAMLAKSFRQDVFKYMNGIITGMGEKAIIVNGVANHVHLLVGFRPATATAEIARVVKTNATNFIKRQIGLKEFAWQEGYGVFTYSKSQVPGLYDYILHQEAHHAKRSFREEYLEFLRNQEIDFAEEKLFDWLPEEAD